jgi:hypothetical protein
VGAFITCYKTYIYHKPLKFFLYKSVSVLILFFKFLDITANMSLAGLCHVTV